MHPKHRPLITPVQAIAICGAQPNPLDPVYLNNGWEPKHWVQDWDKEVSCNKCLALMRAGLRVKLRYKPVYEEARAAGYWTPAKAKRSKPRNELCYASRDNSNVEHGDPGAVIYLNVTDILMNRASQTWFLTADLEPE